MKYKSVLMNKMFYYFVKLYCKGRMGLEFWIILYFDYIFGFFVIFNGDFVVCRFFFKKFLFKYFWVYDDIMKMIIYIIFFLEIKLYIVCVSLNLYVINDDYIFL